MYEKSKPMSVIIIVLTLFIMPPNVSYVNKTKYNNSNRALVIKSVGIL